MIPEDLKPDPVLLSGEELFRMSVAELCVYRRKHFSCGQDAPDGGKGPRDIQGALRLLGNHRWLPYVVQRHRELSIDELRRCWLDAWMGANLNMSRTLPRLETLLKIFRRAGFLTDVERPPSFKRNVTVYRGCLTRQRSMAWTLDRKVAEGFASRLHRPYVTEGRFMVLQAVCPPEAVLAYCGGRSESEVVLDPRFLENVKVVQTGRRTTA